jgi:membrane associated rhomboid family serine protease
MILFFLILTVVISWQAFQNQALLSRLLLEPYAVKHRGEFYRLLSHMLVHADFTHLAFNMMTLYFIGSYLEQIWQLQFGLMNSRIYLFLLYVVGGLCATLWPMIRNQDNPSYRSLGASGAVSAILFAFILWDPTQSLYLMFIPIPIPAYVFGPLYLAFEYYSMRKGKSGIAHDAHIGGAIFGVLFVLLIAPEKGMQFVHLFL